MALKLQLQGHCLVSSGPLRTLFFLTAIAMPSQENMKTGSASSCDAEIAEDVSVRAARAFEGRTMYVSLKYCRDHTDNLNSKRRRMDRRILPILGVLYALALIDRSNLGVARVVGMGKDLVGSLGRFKTKI